jgi:hypothetical protein
MPAEEEAGEEEAGEGEGGASVNGNVSNAAAATAPASFSAEALASAQTSCTATRHVSTAAKRNLKPLTKTVATCCLQKPTLTKPQTPVSNLQDAGDPVAVGARYGVVLADKRAMLAEGSTKRERAQPRLNMVVGLLLRSCSP